MNMGNTFKRILAMVLALTMVLAYVPFNTFATETENEPVVQSETVTGTITENTVWEDGSVIGEVTIDGNVTITVKGTVTVAATIRLSPDAISNVVFNGENEAKLIRGNDFTGQMFYAEGVSGNFQNLTFNNITLDGGAVWTGDVDATLNRGTTNSGVKATGSVLYLVYANADLNYSTLQNHDDSTGEKANAVFLRYYSTIDFNNSVVRDNNSISTYYRGGVITVRQGGTVKTSNAEVYGNSGQKGGFFGTSSTGSFGGVVEVTNSKFHNNYAANGAVFDMQCNSNKGYLLIDGCEFYENASGQGLIYEHSYSRPVIIKDSYFHGNKCAVWDCHADPVLDISGKIVVAEDADYAKYLFETPLVLTGALAEGSSIAMSEASITKLVGSAGYIATGTADYAVTEADMAKFVLPEGKKLITVDVNFDGILDVVPVAEDFEKIEITVTLKDAKNEAASENKTVYANIAYKYNCDTAYTGFVFTGWLKSTDNKTSTAIMAFEADATLTAQWKLANPAVTVSSKDEGANINTLVATVTNQGEGITYAYQWYKDGTAIDGATSAEYTIDATAKYKCVVTASLDGYKNATGNKEVTAELKEVPKNYVAQVGETKYESLQAAVKAAMPGDTIIVIADHEMDCGNPVTNSDGFSALVNVAGKAVTIDLNGKTITVSPKAEQFTDAVDTMLMSVFAVDTNGTLTLKDSVGTGKVAVTANDAKVYSLAVCYGEGGKLNIEGGSYTADEVSSALIYSQHDEVVTITGGNFHLGNVGTGSNGSPWIFNASGQNTKNIIVVGGTYNADIFHQYYIFEVKDTTEVAELLGVPVKAAKNNGDGTWTVVDAVAYVDEQHKADKYYTQNTGYATLEEAIAASGKYVNGENGYTVTLVANAEVTGNATLKEGTTLVCGDYSVVLAAADATLTAPEDLNVTTNVANGKVVCENGTHKVVVSTPVAEVNGTQYESLTEAVAAANAIESGATVTLLADVALDEMLTISGNVTIEGAYTITWADGYTGTLINVDSGASVKLKNLTIDGENAFTFYDDTTTVENGQNWYTRFVNVGEEDKAVNADVIVNAGNLTLMGVTIKNVTIASDNANGKTENTETGYVLKYNDDLAIIKSNGGSVVITNNGSSTKNTKISGNAGLVLNAINANTQIIGNSVIEKNMGCGNKGGIIIANGGTMEISGASGIVVNKAMARSATILGVINGAEVTFGGLVDYGGDELYDDGTSMSYNKHIGVGSNTAGAMIVLEGASRFVMNGGTIWDNAGGRAGAIASRWVGGSYGQHEETSIVLNAGSIKRNTASNDSWNGASIFLRSPATIGEGMTIDGTIAVNAAPGALEITGGTFNGELIVTDGLTAEITGGTFNYDPSAWCAEGYLAETKDEGATYTVRKANYVAQVGETKYESLTEALNACTNGETVKLIADIVYDADDVVYAHGGATGFGNYDQYNPSIIYVGGTRVDGVNSPSNVNAVIDLNGHTITNNANAYLFLFMDNCKIKFVDSQNGNGIIGNTAVPIIWVTGTDTLVTIESGKYTTANAEGLIWATHSGDLVIKGGEFSTTADDASLLIIRNSHDRQNSEYFISGKSTVTVTGGSFKGFNPEKMFDDSTDPFTEFNAVAEDYEAVANGEYYTVQKFDYVKWVKEQLLAGNDVTLDRDILITDYDLVNALNLPSTGNGKYNEAYGNGAVFHVTKPGVVLDLNGHSIVWDAHHDDYCNKCQVSLFLVTGTGVAGETADLTVKDSVGTGKVDVYGMGSGMYVLTVNATGTIEGGTWTNYPCNTCGASNIFLYPSHGGELVISGGTFEQKNSEYLLGWFGASESTNENSVGVDYDQTKVTITGGTFVNFDPEEVKFIDFSNNGAESIADGCAKGYEAVDNGNDTWTVMHEPIAIVTFDRYVGGKPMVNAAKAEVLIRDPAQFTGEWFQTIIDAQIAPFTVENFTVTLCADVELTGYLNITIADEITLDLNGYKITREGTGIYVNNADTVLTIKDSSEAKTGKISATQAVWAAAGKVVIESGSFHGTGDTIYTSGSGAIEIKGGTFSAEETDHTNNKYCVLNQKDSDRETSSITVYGGTFVGFNPENNASEGANTNFVAEGYGVEQDGENYIVKPVITVTFDNLTMVEGNELPEFTWTSNFTEVSEDGEMLVVGNPEVTVNGVGEYEITAEAYVFMSDKYIVKVVPGTLTVVEAVAEMNGVNYASIQAAVKAAVDDDVITVIADHALDANAVTAKSMIYVNGKKITIDLAGHTVTADTGVNTTGTAWSLLYAANGADVTIKGNGKIHLIGDDKNLPYMFWASAATITVENGTYVMDNSKTAGGKDGAVSHTFYASSAGSIVINDGIYTNDGKWDIFNLKDGSGSNIYVNGGTFDEDIMVGEEGENLIIREGYEVVDNRNGTWTVQEKKTEVEKNFQFGQTSQIWLIEPWALRANLYVYHVNADGTRGAELTAEELAQFDDYGVYFIRESDLGIADATQDNITVDDIINNENVIVKTMQNGCSIKSDKRNGLWADFDEGIYTYQLSDSVFVLYYIVVDGETIYAPIRERNLSEMVEAGITDTVNYKESERAIFAKMHQLEIDILEYRGGAHDTTLEIMDAPTLGQNPIGNAAEHNLTFGHTTAVSLIEPWGIQLNGRVTLDKEYDDYGVIVFYDTENEIDETVTAEMLLAMENAYVFSYANGDATIEVESDGRTRITALYNSGLYTYQMKRTAYVMFYVKDGDNIYCGPVKERSIESAILSRLNVAGVADTKEGKVLQDMLALYEVTAEHRGVE